ncbi:hypothetical protein JAB1_46360 [Janthinobacterium sp. MP5059B]|uniref:hypothetical protein n=1 Tax=Janthinobacterium sp. MP5059B TaxID=1766683 RepID=UPI000892E8EB|nr:hypothetical protein [Janthinobacterium sp. MP5059B]OEZ46698.1 hypothetical protein JAB1_46360 [Janthinobacterium sp. MP5059B]
MSASQPALFNVQEFTDDGITLVGGRLYTYAFGTTTQKVAYTDPEGTVPQTYTADGLGGQYIALNARGELPTPLYLASTGAYDINLKRADGSTVWTRKAEGVGNLGFALASPSGSTYIGNGGESVAQSFEALQLLDYAAVRASTSPRKSIYVTGIMGQSFGGIAGMFLRDDSDTTSADNGGTTIVRADGIRYKRAGVERMNILWFEAVPSQLINNSPMIQAAVNAGKLIGVGIYIPSVTAIGYRIDQGIVLPEFFVGIIGDSSVFSTLNYTGLGTAISFATTTGKLGVYSNFQVQSGLSTDSVATRRAVARNGIFWKCYGGQGEIKNVRTFGFNGFGQKYEAIWDSIVESPVVEECGNDLEYAWGVFNGTDTSNHTNFNRVQIETCHGKAMYFSGLNNVMIGLHSERTIGNGTDFTHIITGDVSVIDSRIEGTSNVKTQIGVATGFLQGLKIFSGPVEFRYSSRLAIQAMIEGCNFGGDVSIPSGNLRQYEFKACGFGAAVNIGYSEKQTVFTSCFITGGMTLTGTGCRVEFYGGSISNNIITTGGGNNSVEIHDSVLAYYPTVDFVSIFNSDVLNAHVTPFGQKAVSTNVIFSGTVTIGSGNVKWSSSGCEYKAGVTLGAGTPGWKFGAGDFVSGGSVSAGLLAAPSGANAAFSLGERTYRLIPAVGQPKSWVCTTAGSAPTLAFTSEGNL